MTGISVVAKPFYKGSLTLRDLGSAFNPYPANVENMVSS